MNPVEEDRALDGESDLTYDDGRRGRAAMDPTTRHLVFIACGIGLLLLVLIGGWTFSNRSPSSIPVIEALPGPVRLKPVDPGGMQAMGAQAPATVSASGVETLAPRPEAARPEALQAEMQAARGRDAAALRASDTRPQVPAAATAPAVPVPVAPEPRQQPTTRLPDDVPGSMPGSMPGSPSDANRSLVGIGASRTIPASGVRPAVQLAALDSHDAAQTEWSRLRLGHPRLFSGRKPLVEPADHAGRLIYRLRTGGFASMADAHAFCEQAHAQRVACTLADF